MILSKSNYDKWPVIDVPGAGSAAVKGWDACTERLLQAIATRGAKKNRVGGRVLSRRG